MFFNLMSGVMEPFVNHASFDLHAKMRVTCDVRMSERSLDEGRVIHDELDRSISRSKM